MPWRHASNRSDKSKMFQRSTRVGALLKIGVTGVVVFLDYHSMADNQIVSK